MSETTEIKARREITFSDVGIPGVHATFQHEKQIWMAAPVLKARALFNRGQYLASRAAHAQKLLSRVVERHPEMYLEIRPVLLVLDAAAARVPWGSALDAEIAAAAEARAAEKKLARARAGAKLTH